MLPELISIGPFHLSSLGVFLVLSLFAVVFRVWKSARDRGIEDDKIFDNLVIIILSALIGARLFFAASHWDLFSETWLRIFMIWKVPGLSWIGGLLGGLTAFLLYTPRQKVPAAVIFDSYGVSIPWVLLLISLGVFLDGSVLGTETALPWAIPFPGLAGRRHPVSLYAGILALILLLFLLVFRLLTRNKKVAPGLIGWGMISLLGLIQLVLAFFRADLLYFDRVSLDHFIAIILTLAPFGPLFVLVNGPAKVKAVVKRMRKKG